MTLAAMFSAGSVGEVVQPLDVVVEPRLFSDLHIVPVAAAFFLEVSQLGLATIDFGWMRC